MAQTAPLLRTAAALALGMGMAHAAWAHVFPNQTIINQGTLWNDDVEQAHGWELQGGLLTQTVTSTGPRAEGDPLAYQPLPWEEPSTRAGLPVGSWSDRVAVVPSDALERMGQRGAVISADVAFVPGAAEDDSTSTARQGLVFFVDDEFPAPGGGLAVVIDQQGAERSLQVTWPGGATEPVALAPEAIRPATNAPLRGAEDGLWVRLSVRLAHTPEGTVRVSATALPLSFEQGTRALAQAEAEVSPALFGGTQWGLAASTQTAREDSATVFYFDQVTATRGAALPGSEDSTLRVVGLAPSNTPSRVEDDS